MLIACAEQGREEGPGEQVFETALTRQRGCEELTPGGRGSHREDCRILLQDVRRGSVVVSSVKETASEEGLRSPVEKGNRTRGERIGHRRGEDGPARQ